MSVQTTASDLHSSWGGIVPNPVWRLAWALNTLKGPDERVLIPGFYDAVRAPTSTELAVLERMGFDEAKTRQQMELKGFVNDLTGLPLLVKHIFQPTCTVCGITGGYQGPGLKTVLPARASLKLDFRLVPDQDPNVIYSALRRHLDDQGFTDIQLTLLSQSFPARTPLTDPLARVVIETAREVYNTEPAVFPLTPDPAPCTTCASASPSPPSPPASATRVPTPTPPTKTSPSMILSRVSNISPASSRAIPRRFFSQSPDRSSIPYDHLSLFDPNSSKSPLL